MPNATLAPIESDVCYPLPVFMDITGQGRVALKTARENGLPVRKIGNRKFILGRDWLEYVESHGTTDEDAA